MHAATIPTDSQPEHKEDEKSPKPMQTIPDIPSILENKERAKERAKMRTLPGNRTCQGGNQNIDASNLEKPSIKDAVQFRWVRLNTATENIPSTRKIPGDKKTLKMLGRHKMSTSGPFWGRRLVGSLGTSSIMAIKGRGVITVGRHP